MNSLPHPLFSVCGVFRRGAALALSAALCCAPLAAHAQFATGNSDSTAGGNAGLGFTPWDGTAATETLAGSINQTVTIANETINEVNTTNTNSANVQGEINNVYTTINSANNLATAAYNLASNANAVSNIANSSSSSATTLSSDANNTSAQVIVDSQSAPTGAAPIPSNGFVNIIGSDSCFPSTAVRADGSTMLMGGSTCD